MGKVKSNKKTAKSKNEPVIGPRMRLEPYITPKSRKKGDKQDKNAEDGTSFLNTNEITEDNYQAASLHDNSLEVTRYDYEQESVATCASDNNLSDAESMDYKESEDAQSSNYEPENDDDEDEDDDDWRKTTVKKQRKRPTIKVTKKSIIAPKINLKPRFMSRSTKTDKNMEHKETEDNSRFLRTSGTGESSSEVAVSSTLLLSALLQNDDLCDETEIGSEQDTKASDLLNSCSVSGINKNCRSTEEVTQILDDDDDDDIDENITVMKSKRNVRGSPDWNDRELMDLAIGLQSEGFADLKKVAEYVKTKNENDIELYMKRRTVEARKTENTNQPRSKPYNKFCTTSAENIATWPNIRKWRKLAHNQMLPLVKQKDYSKPVIKALCKKFYEEEEEPPDPQVINVKLIYKYMMDCMSGEIPAQLPPKESALVLDLLREARLMPIAYDFEEELKFLHDFKEALKFKPFHVKDEFKKRFKKVDEEILGSNAVSVPEEVFMDLSRHKKLVQSFNPLITPVWMLQKEQELLENAEKSNVYVD